MKPLLPNGRLCVRATAILLLSILIAVVFLLPHAHAAGTFTVNSLADTPDAAQGNGTCADVITRSSGCDDGRRDDRVRRPRLRPASGHRRLLAQPPAVRLGEPGPAALPRRALT